MKEYAIYKGERMLFIGTSKECAEHFNVTQKTVYFWATPTQVKRDKRNRKIAVRI